MNDLAIFACGLLTGGSATALAISWWVDRNVRKAIQIHREANEKLQMAINMFEETPND